MNVVSTGSTITSVMGTEVSKLSIGRDTVMGCGVGVGVGAGVGVGVGVPVAVAVGVAEGVACDPIMVMRPLA